MADRHAGPATASSAAAAAALLQPGGVSRGEVEVKDTHPEASATAVLPAAVEPATAASSSRTMSTAEWVSRLQSELWAFTLVLVLRPVKWTAELMIGLLEALLVAYDRAAAVDPVRARLD